MLDEEVPHPSKIALLTPRPVVDEAVKGLHEDLGVPDLAEGTGGVAKGLVLPPVAAGTQRLSDEAQRRSRTLETLARVVDRFVRRRTLGFDCLERLRHVAAHDAPDALGRGLAFLQASRHDSLSPATETG